MQFHAMPPRPLFHRLVGRVLLAKRLPLTRGCLKCDIGMEDLSISPLVVFCYRTLEESSEIDEKHILTLPIFRYSEYVRFASKYTLTQIKKEATKCSKRNGNTTARRCRSKGQQHLSGIKTVETALPARDDRYDRTKWLVRAEKK